ncbi:hypothetical protein BHM03_00051635 [Ensete ventricosum]|nr:hypothetical protein BHM03_00051635 [Ensete ventricosum]
MSVGNEVSGSAWIYVLGISTSGWELRFLFLESAVSVYHVKLVGCLLGRGDRCTCLVVVYQARLVGCQLGRGGRCAYLAVVCQVGLVSSLPGRGDRCTCLAVACQARLVDCLSGWSICLSNLRLSGQDYRRDPCCRGSLVPVCRLDSGHR